MALSSKARARLTAAMAHKVYAKEVADAIDASSTVAPTEIALAQNHVLVGNSGGLATDVAVSGDATMVASGALTVVAGAITKAKAKVFVSTVQTGTGSSQNVAHGLGTTPSLVLIVPVVTAGAVGIAEGAHGSTNVVVTVTASDTFKVMAWA